MSDEKDERVKRPDYSLLLDNLRKALYTRKDNPYTDDGSVFYLAEDRGAKKIAKQYEEWFDKKRTLFETSFLPFDEYKDFLGQYATSPGTGRSQVEINKKRLWTAHLAGWKRLGQSPDGSQLQYLFQDSKNATKKYRQEFYKDLQTTKFVKYENEKIDFYTTGEDESDSEISKIMGSEYIVLCNYHIIRDYCGGRKHLLRKIILDFAGNIRDAERNRLIKGEKSLLSDKANEIDDLCFCLDHMMKEYDKLTNSTIDKKEDKKD